MAKKRASIADADLFKTTEESQDAKAASSQNVNKKKLTLYITPETAVMLDLAWMKIRHATGEALSRSDIIEAAIVATLADDDYSQVIDALTLNG